MKKIIALTMILILAISAVACAAGTPDDYFKLFSGGVYHMKAKIIGSDGTKSTMETYCKGGMTATVIEMEGNSSRMIFRDDTVYIIMDAEKSYMQMPAQASRSKPVVDTGGKVSVGSGTDEFNGKKLRYEEYKDSDGNRMRMFFDGKELAGMRNTGEGCTVDVVILQLDQKVPDDVFKIPGGYKKRG